MTVPDLHFVQLARPYSFVSPVPGKEFAAWIVASDATLTKEERNVISAELVASGCRYALCSGIDCSGWDDAVDWAYLDTCPDDQPRDENFVMTTWHEHQTLPETAFFFVWNTAFDDWVAPELVVVSVGKGPDGINALAEARRELAERAAR